MLEIFNLNFLVCWFILSNTLKFLYNKFRESVAKITAKFRFHASINFLIHLNLLFSLYFYAFCIIQSGNVVKFDPGPKSGLSSGLPICHWNLNSFATCNFSKVNLLQVYDSVHCFDFICLSQTFLDSTIQLDYPDLVINDYTLVGDNHLDNVKRVGACIFYQRSSTIYFPYYQGSTYEPLFLAILMSSHLERLFFQVFQGN